MADETENKKAREESDVKQSFAWGQLFAGSLIGGLAVWKLLHKMTNTEPSEWFRGLSVAYEEVRDFLLTPFQWIQVDLHEYEKNTLIYSLVITGAFVRASVSTPRSVAPFAASFIFWVAAFCLYTWDMYHVWQRMEASVITVGYATLLLACVVTPMVNLLLGRRSTNQLDNQILLNLTFTALFGTILLLLNWATS